MWMGIGNRKGCIVFFSRVLFFPKVFGMVKMVSKYDL